MGEYDEIIKHLEKITRRTNADRIRNMSDEELASLFGSTCDCDNACCFIHNKGVSCMNGCEAAWLEWLKEEVKE